MSLYRDLGYWFTGSPAMDIPLCQLVILMGYILHYLECRSHDQQYSSDSVHPVSCSGTLSQLTGRKLIFLSDERKLSLIIKDDGSGSYVCLLIDDDRCDFFFPWYLYFIPQKKNLLLFLFIPCSSSFLY